ncbi:MAG: hypothetical protein HY276_02145 [Ignavibacteriales bacterium]|nr:hypothetical protein [Ignavibacteriales bacterium]
MEKIIVVFEQMSALRYEQARTLCEREDIFGLSNGHLDDNRSAYEHHQKSPFSRKSVVILLVKLSFT